MKFRRYPTRPWQHERPKTVSQMYVPLTFNVWQESLVYHRNGEIGWRGRGWYFRQNNWTYVNSHSLAVHGTSIMRVRHTEPREKVFK